MFSSWAYIFVGDNNTGKTSFQRYLVEALCSEQYDRLPRNIVKEIKHPRAPKKLNTLFTINRSYQEKMNEYKSVENYFKSFFKDADICILSSHSHANSIQHVEKMMGELASKAYNVAGVFWSNDFGTDAKQIVLFLGKKGYGLKIQSLKIRKKFQYKSESKHTNLLRY